MEDRDVHLEASLREELELLDVVHDSAEVGLPINEQDDDSAFDSCDNVDKCNVGDDCD